MQRRQLRGHTKSILCIDACERSAESNVVLTGSEDCTARLWDLRTDRAQKCFAGCFNGEPVDSLSLGPRSIQEHLVYMGSGGNVYIFDLRREGILDRQPIAIAGVIPEGEDTDVNAISVHPKGHRLAVASDDGGVHMVDLASVLANANVAQLPGAPPPSPLRSSQNLDSSQEGVQLPEVNTSATRRLSWGHENIASSVAFRPAPISSDDLISGGFDCELVLWEHSSGRRKTHRSVAGEASLGVNPPFVYDSAYACSGRAVICATGDGAVSLWEAGSLLPLARKDAHSSFTSCVHVPTGTNAIDHPSGSGVSVSVAFSGGNDGKINAWHIQETPKSSKQKAKNGKKQTGAGDDVASAGAGNGVGTDLVSLWVLDHGDKVNAIATWAGSRVRRANSTSASTDELHTEDGAFHLFVADTSKDLSVYTYSS